jgi:hypothetical protein
MSMYPKVLRKPIKKEENCGPSSASVYLQQNGV